MREELQRWLDGDMDPAELPEELRAEARLWQEWLEARRDPEPRAPGWVANAVMARIATVDRAGPVTRFARWLVRPWTLTVRPLSVAALAAAALAAVVLWPRTAAPPTQPATSGGAVATVAHEGRVYVQFMYVGPQASSVAVAGDFNEWSPTGAQLRDLDGDGVWTAYIPVTPGLHKYMFVVDGEWRTDPRAERHVDDGFGHSNALMSVLPPGSAI